MPAGELRPLVDDAQPKMLFFGDEDSEVARELDGTGMHPVGFDVSGSGGYVALRDSAEPVRGREL